MTTKQLGNIGEAKTLAKFVSMKIPTYQAFGDNEKADLVIDINGQLKKVQCKSSEKFESNKFTVSLVTTNSTGKHKYSKEDVDYFSLYNLQSDTLLLVPIEDVIGRTQVSFTIPYKESHNNQGKSLNYEDYTFENVLNKINCRIGVNG